MWLCCANLGDANLEPLSYSYVQPDLFCQNTVTQQNTPSINNRLHSNNYLHFNIHTMIRPRENWLSASESIRFQGCCFLCRKDEGKEVSMEVIRVRISFPHSVKTIFLFLGMLKFLP